MQTIVQILILNIDLSETENQAKPINFSQKGKQVSEFNIKFIKK